MIAEKLLPWDSLSFWRRIIRSKGRRLVVTNGCFDLLHAGHVTYLEAARREGDTLLVGLNGDASVRQLKGEGRPINNETDRALVLAALASVSGVCIFTDTTATEFLELAKPDIYVKGGDYTLESLNKDERNAVESAGGKILIIPMVPNRSTTAMLARMGK